MSTLATQTCRSCGAAVIWAEHHRTGRRMIFDAVGSEDGTWALGRDDEGRLVAAPKSALPDGADDGVPLRVSHFATCPDAPAWRGKGSRR